MSHRFLPSTGVLVLMIIVVFLASVSVACQTERSAQNANAWTPPRTLDGQPDLQGVWDFSNITPMERPPALAGKAELTEEEAAEYERLAQDKKTKKWIQHFPPCEAAEVKIYPHRCGGELPYDARVWGDGGTTVGRTRRTSLVVDPPDGRVPSFTPEAAKKDRALWEARYRAENPEDRSVDERCLIGLNSGPPMVPGPYINNVQIFQTTESVVLLNEMNHSARVVPLDGRPHGNIRQWRGDSRGRWEGNTLIVDTSNFLREAWYSVVGTKLDLETRQNWVSKGDLHLVERFTRVDADTLLYEFTVNDPTVWMKPWTLQTPMRKVEGLTGTLFEYACHEGNYGLEGILSAARAEEKKAAEGAARRKGTR